MVPIHKQQHRCSADFAPDTARTISSSQTRLLDLGPHGVAHLCVLEFIASEFKQKLFQDELIEMPAGIHRSVEKRQAEFFYGRLAARCALRLAGCTKYEYGVGIGTDRQPVWPAGAIGSITHTNRFAAAAVMSLGADLALGIDVEHTVTGDAHPTVLRLVVDLDEEHILRDGAAIAGLSFPQALTLAYSAKESFFKAAYRQVGSYFAFDTVRVLEIDRQERRIWFRQHRSLDYPFLAGSRHGVWYDFLDEDTVFTAFASTLASSDGMRA